jgi:hypothetical protein
MPNEKNLKDYQIAAIAEGYAFECGCGELYKRSDDAWSCRKCRKYLSLDSYTAREVVDIRTGEVVP